MEIKTEWKSNHDALENLKALKEGLQKSIIKKAIRKGAVDIKRDMKANAPKRSGALKTSIGSKVWSKRSQAIVLGIVGPKTKYEKVVNGHVQKPYKYAKFLDTGSKFIPARHIFSAAYQRRSGQYLETVANVVTEEIAKQLAKGA